MTFRLQTATLFRGLAAWLIVATGMVIAPLPAGAEDPTYLVGLNSADLPPSAGLAVGAAILAMRGVDERAVDLVRFDGDTHARLFERDFDYSGFRVPGITFVAFDAVNTGRFRTAAMVSFVDDLNRRTAVTLYLTYRVEKDGTVIIERATAMPVYPRRPEVEMYVLPADAVPRDLPATHAELYSLLLRKSMTADAAGAALRSGKPCYLFAVAKDRLARGARIDLSLVTPSATVDRAQDYDYDGWHAAALGAKLRPTPDGALVAHVLLIPGQPAAADRRKVGHFVFD